MARRLLPPEGCFCTGRQSERRSWIRLIVLLALPAARYPVAERERGAGDDAVESGRTFHAKAPVHRHRETGATQHELMPTQVCPRWHVGVHAAHAAACLDIRLHPTENTNVVEVETRGLPASSESIEQATGSQGRFAG